MPTIVIKIIYDDMEKVSKIFNQQQNQIAQVNKKLKSAQEQLEGGKDWIGHGATQFYNEMNSDIMPAMKRLEQAMGQASQISKKIHGIMKQAEDESASVFKI